MRFSKDSPIGKAPALALAGVILLLSAGQAAAQTITGQTIGSGGAVTTSTAGGGNFGGTSTISNNGGGGSSSFGRSGGSSGSSGSFGGSSFGSSGSVTGANSMSNPFTGTNGRSNGITFNGQSITAGGTAGRPGVGSTASTGPTAGNLFAPYYNNPLAMGILNATNSTFGQPIYNSTTGGVGGTVGGRVGGLTGQGGIAGISGIGQAGLNSVGGSSIGIRRAPVYFTTLGYTLPRPFVAPLTVRNDLQLALGRTTMLPSREGLQVLMDGQTVVLRGRVADDRERRLAENVLRLSPGVRAIRNEIEVPAR